MGSEGKRFGVDGEGVVQRYVLYQRLLILTDGLDKMKQRSVLGMVQLRSALAQCTTPLRNTNKR